MVICLERGADLHMAQLIPLQLTVSCFSKIQIGFTFLVLAHLGSPGKRAVKRVCVHKSVNHMIGRYMYPAYVTFDAKGHLIVMKQIRLQKDNSQVTQKINYLLSTTQKYT